MSTTHDQEHFIPAHGTSESGEAPQGEVSTSRSWMRRHTKGLILATGIVAAAAVGTTAAAENFGSSSPKGSVTAPSKDTNKLGTAPESNTSPSATSIPTQSPEQAPVSPALQLSNDFLNKLLTGDAAGSYAELNDYGKGEGTLTTGKWQQTVYSEVALFYDQKPTLVASTVPTNIPATNEYTYSIQGSDGKEYDIIVDVLNADGTAKVAGFGTFESSLITLPTPASSER